MSLQTLRKIYIGYLDLRLKTHLKAAIAQLMGLRCIFCLMSRETTILFIPSSFHEIHSWHAVNQGFM